ncbi:GtrA family protein [Fluoribacter gormanii]|uniref:Flippase GtrA (Transmembrane translocase of bactoprenol-linked glucose) n=1 Tax=Fluoribacter gormanii TaxID=464 RepID=A0A377GFR9_9GAMM|nr:GtrA family protein [Fluoribacter gormanii]KTD05267.1 GtrA-like protein [Fluoribacter gormanii]MCW8444828.1 GtrA family protein [Fluoribacter gormanii]MCW8470036.1 GtrA family protein [Fluoribacter gormanii]SIR70415.1 Putative flippase GtrA (transmembrane translocase of bactoprenol-linked glucose) [Fluoribacter gormanii]STO23608.1 GtrA-like protein [Fluoribacter gormanii]
MTTKLKLRHRLIFFIGIGSSAALIHLFTVFNLVKYMHVQALVANIFAFLIAFNVSFLGHKYLTFSQLHDEKTLSLPHFFIVAASAGLINEMLYFLLLRYTSLNYLFALFLVLGCVSVYSFIISRFWACRQIQRNKS